MPETLDELFAAASADIATRTRPRGAEQAMATSRRRTGGVVASAAAAVAVGVVFFTVAVDDSSDAPDPAPSPSFPTGLDVGAVPVWYDAAGLHRGDVVEQTAEVLRANESGGAVLTLVRTGALYLDASHDVWFHPWGGEPRIVGHGSEWGPAGDPEGDNAAWFEGSELVVYDTDAGREVARMSAPSVRAHGGQEHVTSGNGFLQVAPNAVVWLSDAEPQTAVTLDLRTQLVTESPAGTILSSEPSLGDVHDDREVWWSGVADIPGDLSIRGAEGTDEYSAFEPTGRISPDGRFFLGVRSREVPHGTYLVDLESGESVRLPARDEDFSSWNAWSYGDTAVVAVGADGGPPGVQELLACDAEQGVCRELEFSGDVVLPS